MKPISRASAWLFPEGSAFPVVSGDLHPLKLHARGLLGRGIIAAVGLHFVVFGAWIIQRSLVTGDLPLLDLPVTGGEVTIVAPPVPPPIDPGSQRIIESVNSEAPLESGVPDPVDDFRVLESNWASPEDWIKQQPVAEDPGSGGDQIVIQSSPLAEVDPDPDTFVVVEEDAYPIQSSAPVYPEMARAAEVEGLVLVRALVNKEGKVEKVIVVSGHPMLNDAAVAAVRAWVFRPAMQQHRPVKVWVAVPIRFVLH